MNSFKKPSTASKKITSVLLALFLVLVVSGCQSAKSKFVKSSYGKIFLEQDKDQENDQVNRIMKTAFSQVGTRYVYGGNSPDVGFDCSGFVKWVFGQYGVDLPRNSRSMMRVGTPVARDELRPGDLIFFNYGYSHVGIYTGDDKYIHSPRRGKTIQENKLSERGRGNRYVTARRIIDNSNTDSISESLKQQWIASSRNQLKGQNTLKASNKKSSKTASLKGSKKSTKNSKKSALKASKSKQSKVVKASPKKSTAKVASLSKKTSNKQKTKVKKQRK